MNNCPHGKAQRISPPSIWTTLVAACLLLPLWTASAARRPLPPVPELAPVLWSERFDLPCSLGLTNTQESVDGFVFDESWSGYALQRWGRVTPFIVSGVDAQGHTNLSTLTGGALRFWLRPNWSTGSGPGSDTTLAAMHVVGERLPIWWLEVTPDGSALRFVAQSDTGPAELLNAPIAWGSDLFHLVSVNYSPDGTALFVDGWLVAEGPGVLPIPSVLARLALGSTLNGHESAEADFDEAHSFARPLTEPEVARHYAAYRKLVSGWSSRLPSPQRPGTFTLSQAGTSESTTTVELPPGPGEGPYTDANPGDPGLPAYDLNGHLGFLAPILTASNLTLIITNIDAQKSYDLYYTTNLGLLAAPALCATNWAWWSRISPGQTNFTLTFLPQPECYFMLGAMDDGDRDGLPDAYERLVSHTATDAFDLAAHDGIPDGWLVLQGIDPLAQGVGGLDPDQDALSHRQEYLWGSDPGNREEFRVWVSVPSAVAGLP